MILCWWRGIQMQNIKGTVVNQCLDKEFGLLSVSIGIFLSALSHSLLAQKLTRIFQKRFLKINEIYLQFNK